VLLAAFSGRFSGRKHYGHVSLGADRGTEDIRSLFEVEHMKRLMLKVWVGAQILWEDSGQDLIEYALTAGLIGVACIATMSNLAASISVGFGQIGGKITSLSS
jgi:pilus assembly protein Flp/PilA